VSRLLKFAMIPLLVGLTAGTLPSQPSKIVIAVAYDGSVKITRNGKIIDCGQLTEMMRESLKDRHVKPFDCRHIRKAH
jgi:hypothetical protein